MVSLLDPARGNSEDVSENSRGLFGARDAGQGVTRQFELTPRILAFVSVLFLSALGFLLRICRLDAQSFDLFEFFAGAGFTNAADTKTFLGVAQFVGPERVPVYDALQYWWVQAVGFSFWRVRLFSILLSVSAIPFLYLLGRRLYGFTGGFVAALCMTLSVVHVYFAQAPRVYALVTFLSVVSMYTFVKAWRDGGATWWFANLATNLVLVWTQLPPVLLVVAELAFAVLFVRRRHPSVVAWGVLQVLLLVPSGLWVLRLPFIQDFEFQRSLTRVVLNIVGDDVISTYFPTAYVDPSAPAYLLRARPWFDLGLIVAFSCVIGFLLVTIWLSLRRIRREASATPAWHALESASLLTFIVLLPITVLTTLAYLWNRPLLFPRLTLYSAPALYAATGGLAAALNRKSVRACAVVALTALYAYQLVLFIPATVRTDWFSAAAYVKAKAHPNDLILVGGFEGTPVIFRFHSGETETPVAGVHSLQAVCDASTCFLARPTVGGPSLEGERAVWYVHMQNYRSGRRHRLEEALSWCGLAYWSKEFLGGANLIVYRIVRGPEFEAPRIAERVTVLGESRYEEFLASIGFPPTETDRRSEALAVAQRMFDFSGPLDRMGCAFMATHFLEAGYADMAEALARRGLDIAPDFGLGYFALGLAFAQQGDSTAATEAFDRAYESHPAIGKAFKPFAAALCSAQDFDKAYAQALKLEFLNVPISPQMCAVCLNAFDAPGMRPPAGLFPTREEYRNAIESAFSSARRLAAEEAGVLRVKGGLIEPLKNLKGALRFYREKVYTAPDEFEPCDRLNEVLLKYGDPDLAVEQWWEVLSRVPENARAQYWLGKALQETGRMAEARWDYCEPVERRASCALGHTELPNATMEAAQKLEMRSAYDEAVAAYSRIIGVYPDHAEPFNRLDLLLETHYDSTARVARWKEIVARCPNAARAHFHLGMALEAHEDLDGAIDAYRVAAQLDPSDAAMVTSLGMALMEEGDFENAIAPLRKALALNPNMPHVREKLGQALHKAGQRR